MPIIPFSSRFLREIMKYLSLSSLEGVLQTVNSWIDQKFMEVLEREKDCRELISHKDFHKGSERDNLW